MEENIQFTMRMESKLYAKLKLRSERNKRSIAKELEYIVEKAIARDEEYKARAKAVAKVLKEGKISEEEIAEYKNLMYRFSPEIVDALNQEL